MSMSLGSTSIGSLYLGSSKIGEAYFGSVKVYPSTPDPYNPLHLPSYTIRLLYADGVVPTFFYGTGVQVSSSPNVWDLTKTSSDWSGLLYTHSASACGELLKVLGANTAGVTDMSDMFCACYSLNEVCLFDTSSVTNMSNMFFTCDNITTLPTYDTHNVTDMRYMLAYCHRLAVIPLFNTGSVQYADSAFYYMRYVETGSLALYNQMSTQANPPSSYTNCFANCGYDTVTGAAELSQIPSSWGGTGS